MYFLCRISGCLLTTYIDMEKIVLCHFRGFVSSLLVLLWNHSSPVWVHLLFLLFSLSDSSFSPWSFLPGSFPSVELNFVSLFPVPHCRVLYRRPKRPLVTKSKFVFLLLFMPAGFASWHFLLYFSSKSFLWFFFVGLSVKTLSLLFIFSCVGCWFFPGLRFWICSLHSQWEDFSCFQRLAP